MGEECAEFTQLNTKIDDDKYLILIISLWQLIAEDTFMDNLVTQGSVFKITIRGRLQEKWVLWLNGMIMSLENTVPGNNETIITVRIPDQAALRGILNKISDLNLTIISLVLVEDNPT